MEEKLLSDERGQIDVKTDSIKLFSDMEYTTLLSVKVKALFPIQALVLWLYSGMTGHLRKEPQCSHHTWLIFFFLIFFGPAPRGRKSFLQADLFSLCLREDN